MNERPNIYNNTKGVSIVAHTFNALRTDEIMKKLSINYNILQEKLYARRIF